MKGAYLENIGNILIVKMAEYTVQNLFVMELIYFLIRHEIDLLFIVCKEYDFH